MAIRVGCLHDAVALGIILVGQVPTDKQLADGLTKALARVKFEEWCGMIGCVSVVLGHELCSGLRAMATCVSELTLLRKENAELKAALSVIHKLSA